MMASSSSVKKVSTAARFSEVGSARKRVADSVALVMASSGEAIVAKEGEEARSRKGCGESALARPRRNKEKRFLLFWIKREKRAGNYSGSTLGVRVANAGKTTETLPTKTSRELRSTRQTS